MFTPDILKKILKGTWTPYLLILLFWILISQFFSFWSDTYQAIFLFSRIALTLSVVYIAYKIIVDNKKEVHKIFFGFAKLFLLILGSYILVFISGKTLSSEGGWLFLYVLFPCCILAAMALFTIGEALKFYKKRK